ncbi:MAG: zinc ribbon domain-containing protein [Anaerohalosphaeraceae bacterium]|nr:zinc ribbon domain-containing protein [Anaerohalosphaeraceae bacterium]
MKSFKLKLVLSTIALLGAICTAVSPRWHARSKVDMGQFIKEIMIINIDGKQMNSAIWLPFEFNARASASAGESIAETEKELAFLKSYLIFMVQSSLERTDGSLRYASEAETKARAVLRCKDGTTAHPLEDIPAKLAGRLEALKSVMASSGQGSENMHILVFPFKDRNGKTIVDAGQRDKLRLSLRGKGVFNSREFVWRTPFEAVFNGGVCNKCNEKVKAKWSFCPWCGNKL